MKRLFLTLAFGLATFAASSQEIGTLFCQMPDQYIPQLENAWRKDLTDLYKDGKEARLKNNMNGYSTIEKMTADYLRLQSTERTRIELRRLPLINDTYIICMITTVFGPAPDSRIAFFSTDWKPIDASTLWEPASRKDFFRANADTTTVNWQETAAAADIDLIEYRMDEEKPVITAVYTTPQYLSDENRKKISAYLDPAPKQYVWKQSRFEKEF